MHIPKKQLNIENFKHCLRLKESLCDLEIVLFNTAREINRLKEIVNDVLHNETVITNIVSLDTPKEKK